MMNLVLVNLRQYNQSQNWELCYVYQFTHELQVNSGPLSSTVNCAPGDLDIKTLWFI
jgi:hypothetical protein